MFGSLPFSADVFYVLGLIDLKRKVVVVVVFVVAKLLERELSKTRRGILWNSCLLCGRTSWCVLC